MTILWLLLFLLLFGSLAYQAASASVYAVGIGGYLLAYSYLGGTHPFLLVVYWIIYLVLFSVLLSLPLRRTLLTRHAFRIFCKIMPKMSDTERTEMIMK